MYTITGGVSTLRVAATGRTEGAHNPVGDGFPIHSLGRLRCWVVKTEKQKMLEGELYDPLDAELCVDRQKARDLCQALNATREEQKEERARLLAEIFRQSTDVWIQPPFFCDYGWNVSLGSKVFFNFNCVVLDVMPVRIGNNVLFGPSVQIYTATHPISAAERRTWLEAAKPVEIGSDVWVGGGAIICPGVKIGDRTVIGAGSVVTKDIPSDVVAVGNPCRVQRSLKETPVDAVAEATENEGPVSPS